MKILFAFIYTFALCLTLVCVTVLCKMFIPQTRPEDVFIISIFFYLAWKELK